MLRAFFILLSKARWAQRLITSWRFSWRIASRFTAGTTRADVLPVVSALNQQGFRVTLDPLGEHTTSAAEATRAADEIIALLEDIQRQNLVSGVSIKLSQIGLTLSEEMGRANLERVLSAAQRCGNFIRIDMEDSSMVDSTLAAYQWARERGFDNVGMVIQSYLYRSEADVRALLERGTRIRLVKGAYREPPQVAYPKKADVDANYDHLTTLLLTHARKVDPGIGGSLRFPPIAALGTHDLARITFAQGLAQRLALPKEVLEFQMLYGIRSDLQQQLLAAGYPVRVYVPYGTAWYPYLMRRLAERPANVWFILSNFFRK